MKTWQEYFNLLMDVMWDSFDTSPKIARAIETVLSKMPDKDMRILLNLAPVIFMPGDKALGQTFCFPEKLLPEHKQYFRRHIWIYLSPKLNLCEEKTAESVVAHEFAHIILHNSVRAEQIDEAKIEREAEKKIQEWGFAPRKEIKRLERQKQCQ